jgi:predicted CopG family antitoxin
MPKTVTMKIDDDIYEMFKKAAEGDRRSVSNFIEYAALAYLTNEIHVSDEEMNEITGQSSMIKGLKNGLDDIKR